MTQLTTLNLALFSPLSLCPVFILCVPCPAAAVVLHSGYGYGAGIRLDSPLGPVRLEYAWNDQRSARFHVALGYD